MKEIRALALRAVSETLPRFDPADWTNMHGLTLAPEPEEDPKWDTTPPMSEEDRQVLRRVAALRMEIAHRAGEAGSDSYHIAEAVRSARRSPTPEEAQRLAAQPGQESPSQEQADVRPTSLVRKAFGKVTVRVEVGVVVLDAPSVSAAAIPVQPLLEQQG